MCCDGSQRALWSLSYAECCELLPAQSRLPSCNVASHLVILLRSIGRGCSNAFILLIVVQCDVCVLAANRLVILQLSGLSASCVVDVIV